MSDTNTIKNVKAADLPPSLAEKFGLKDGDIVDVTVTPAKRKKGFDRAAFEKIVAEIRELPVLDDRSPDEIIGYDEHGLPT